MSNNYERIKNMSIEEMAKYIIRISKLLAVKSFVDDKLKSLNLPKQFLPNVMFDENVFMLWFLDSDKNLEELEECKENKNDDIEMSGLLANFF